MAVLVECVTSPRSSTMCVCVSSRCHMGNNAHAALSRVKSACTVNMSRRSMCRVASLPFTIYTAHCARDDVT